VSYVEVRGILAVPGKPWKLGKMRASVRWEDGRWSGFEPCIIDVTRRQAEGPVALTATGPFIPSDSPRAAVLLACSCFSRIDALDTDIPTPPLPPLPPGAVSGPRPGNIPA
jgi:hypothetical protein